MGLRKSTNSQPDYSKMSNEELLKLAGQHSAGPDYAQMSDQELLAAAGEAGGGPSPAPEPVKVNPSAARAARQPKSKLESGAAGITNGATFGYTPQIVANLANFGGKVQDMFRGEVINPNGGKPIDRVDYIQARDATAKDLNQARDDNPFTYGAGAVAGALAVPLPGGVAKTAWGAAGRGALYGGLSNPGETEGEISPFQPVERGVNAVLGAGMGAVAKGFSNAAGRATRGQRAAKELDSPGVEQALQGEINAATEKLQKGYLDPRKKAAERTLGKKKITINPRMVIGEADEPGILRSMESRTVEGKKIKQNSAGTGDPRGWDYENNSFNPKFNVKPGDENLTMNAAVADRVRSKLDRRAEIKQQSALADKKVAKSARDTFAAANKLRQERSKVAPELDRNFEEQSFGYGLKKELDNRSKTPISTLTAAPGTDTYGKLSDIDNLAGTNLKSRGADLRRGQYLLGQEVGQNGIPTTKMGMFSKGVRGTVGALSKYGATPVDVVNRRVIDPLTGGRGLSEAFIRQLIEQIARSK